MQHYIQILHGGGDNDELTNLFSFSYSPATISPTSKSPMIT